VGSTLTPKVSSNTLIYCLVNGCSYIKVFIAGATIAGLFLEVKSQHLNIDVSRLSQRPLAILAIVFADRGAIRIAEANFLNSI
jgi:hypothetical protein